MKQNESLTWILYDIRENKIRSRVAKACLEAGLYRVQKSVFLGCIQSNRLDELSVHIEDLIDLKADRVYIFPMCEVDFRKVILQGQAFDQKMVRDEIGNLFL